MAEIKISTQELKSTAIDIRSLNNKMDEDLKDCSNEIEKLRSTWQSDGAEEIRSAMNTLKPKFEEYKNVIESYAKFLDTTAESYESTEQGVQTNAETFG